MVPDAEQPSQSRPSPKRRRGPARRGVSPDPVHTPGVPFTIPNPPLSLLPYFLKLYGEGVGLARAKRLGLAGVGASSNPPSHRGTVQEFMGEGLDWKVLRALDGLGLANVTNSRPPAIVPMDLLVFPYTAIRIKTAE